MQENSLNPSNLLDILNPAYGQVYSNHTQVISTGQDVTFNQNGILNDVSYTPGTSSVNVKRYGHYQVIYQVFTTTQDPQASLGAAYAITINGVPQPNSIYGNSIQAGPQNLNQQLVGSCILKIPAGATVTLRNVGSTTDVLPASEDGNSVISASLTLVKLFAPLA
ncbi:BclA C-terminal domain-containing protein [Bacillus sp. C1]